MKIIKLQGKNEEINSCLDIIKNRGLSYQELDESFNVVNSLSKSKVIEVLSSSSASKLTKKINKAIKSNLEKGLELFDIKQSSNSFGNYSETFLVTLIFQ